ncbi:MAG: MFS transporter, partial [Dehalococcoidia bacterium]
MDTRRLFRPFGGAAPDETDPAFPGWQRSIGFIAFGAGIAAFAMNFWVPFLPIYMRDLGATSETDALFWVAVGMSANGVARILSGPVWGVLADRYGRKPMYVRALFGATATTLIAVVAQEPWHVAVAWACQGLFSGFIPAAVALASVSVPRARLAGALGTVQAAQYTGTTVGPALGAGLAAIAGLRGAILAAALMPAVAGVMVLLSVPRDRVTPATRPSSAPAGRGRWSSRLMEGANGQFLFGLLLYFWVFMTGQLVRLVTPVELGRIQGSEAATGATGIAFFAAGVASVAGVVLLSRWVS